MTCWICSGLPFTFLHFTFTCYILLLHVTFYIFILTNTSTDLPFHSFSSGLWQWRPSFSNQAWRRCWTRWRRGSSWVDRCFRWPSNCFRWRGCDFWSTFPWLEQLRTKKPRLLHRPFFLFNWTIIPIQWNWIVYWYPNSNGNVVIIIIIIQDKTFNFYSEASSSNFLKNDFQVWMLRRIVGRNEAPRVIEAFSLRRIITIITVAAYGCLVLSLNAALFSLETGATKKFHIPFPYCRCR